MRRVWDVLLIGQSAQPIQRAVQDFSQGDERWDGGPCFAVFNGVQTLRTDAYLHRQLTRRPALFLTTLTHPFTQNIFRGFHKFPLPSVINLYYS